VNTWKCEWSISKQARDYALTSPNASLSSQYHSHRTIFHTIQYVQATSRHQVPRARLRSAAADSRGKDYIVRCDGESAAEQSARRRRCTTRQSICTRDTMSQMHREYRRKYARHDLFRKHADGGSSLAGTRAIGRMLLAGKIRPQNSNC
jgi:hypothetical protein